MKKTLSIKLLLIALLLFISSCGRGQISDSESETITTETLASVPTLNLTATPQPLEYIIPKLEPVMLGHGVPNAGGYDPESTEFPHLVILDNSYKFAGWNVLLPEDWVPTCVADTELVIVVEEVEVWLDAQDYVGGPDIHRYRHDLLVQASDPHTGGLLSVRTIKGGEPSGFPQEAPVEQTRIDGESVSFSQLKDLLEVWCNDLSNAQLVLMHDHPVLSVDFSPNGEFLVSGDNGHPYNSSVRIWRIEDLNGTVLHTMETGSMSNKVAFSPNGEFIAVGNATLSLYQVEDWSLVRTFEHPGAYIKGVDFSPDGKLLVTGSYLDMVRVWRIEDGELLTIFEHDDYVNSVAFSPDGEKLAVGGLHPSIYDNNGILIRRLDQDAHMYSYSIAFSPDGQTLAAGLDDNTIQIWQVEDGVLLQTLTHDSAVQSLAFSSDGKMLASGTSGIIYIWRLEDGSLLQTLMGHDIDYLIRSVAFSPDNLLLASGSEDGTVIIWNMEAYGLEGTP